MVITEADVRRCSSEWLLLKILQYSQENTCVGASLNHGVLRCNWADLLMEKSAHHPVCSLDFSETVPDDRH